MTRIAAWVGAGVFSAGVSAAVLAGAGAAHADDDGATKRDTKPAATQDRSDAKAERNSLKRAAKSKDSDTATRSADAESQSESREVRVKRTDKPLRELADSVRSRVRGALKDSTREIRESARELRDEARELREEEPELTESVAAESTSGPATEDADAAQVRVRPPSSIRSALAERHSRLESPGDQSEQIAAPQGAEDAAAKSQALESARPQADSTTTVEKLAAVTPARQDPVEAVHDLLRGLGALALNPEPQNYPKPLSVLGDVVFDTVAALERLVGGDPVVPPQLRDSVEVSTSTLVVSPGHEVESNWYLPKTAAGEPAPSRLIYLQHGFLANGPLYSYTASYLATQTNSIVVTTTYTSNPFEADGMWLGGDNLHEAVAQLFLDPERTALNASLDNAELQAGRPGDIDVPLQFVLVGHSLGGGFGPGVAGYYAEGLLRRRDDDPDAPNHLAGVVIYDAVPMGSIIPDAMERLDALEANGTADPDDDDPNDYIPIYEIGAPLNYLNVFSDVNDQLTQARPGQFTGVVLEDGVHMDPMQGGNPFIQAAAYLIAGFPQPQNPLAVRALSAGWINDMFDKNIDPATGACLQGVVCSGQYGDGGTSFLVSTEEGDAVAVLIGTRRAADLTSLRAISVTDFISAIPAGVLNGLETTCDLFAGGQCPL